MLQQTEKRNFDRMYLHIAIMLGLIIGFSFLPPIGMLTPTGMKLTGIFLAMLYGWTTCDMLWTCLLGMSALALTGAVPMKEFLAQSFGSESIVFILFLFIFTGVIDEVGLINFIANRMISFPCLNGRPWLFSTFLLVGAYIAAAFINMFAAIIVFWGIIYIVAERFGFKPYEKYPTLMILGVTLASSIGGAVMPYKPGPLVILKAYSMAADVPVDFFKYICFSLPVTLLIMLFYVLVCKFVFRPNMGLLKDISVDFADADALVLTKKQKAAIIFLGMFIFMMIATSILPDTFMLAGMINKLGNAGCVFVLLILLSWVKVDGSAMLNFNLMTKHIKWDILMMMAFVIPFASIFTGEGTGVKECIVALLQPILTGLSPTVFLILTLLLATGLTNIANNMVVGAVFATLIVTIGSSMNLDVAPMVAVLSVCVNLALATPAASPMAAMMFGNKAWMKMTDIYKYGIITLVLGFIFAMCIGLVWATAIY